MTPGIRSRRKIGVSQVGYRCHSNGDARNAIKSNTSVRKRIVYQRNSQREVSSYIPYKNTIFCESLTYQQIVRNLILFPQTLINLFTQHCHQKENRLSQNIHNERFPHFSTKSSSSWPKHLLVRISLHMNQAAAVKLVSNVHYWFGTDWWIFGPGISAVDKAITGKQVPFLTYNFHTLTLVRWDKHHCCITANDNKKHWSIPRDSSEIQIENTMFVEGLNLQV